LCDDGIDGAVCTRCRYPSAPPVPRCPDCGAPTEPARFAPRGRVWSATTVHIEVGPFGPATLTSVDLEDGPRVLVRGGPAVPVGAAVELVEGDEGIEVRTCG
jgi:uncharacterized OB-fold protein